MGNFWIEQFDSSSSSPSSTRPSSPGITKSTSNVGMHSGTGSAFSSSLNEVSPYCQILPITPTSRIFSFAESKKATRNFSLDTLTGGGDFWPIFKGWIDEKTFAPTKAGSGMAIAVKKMKMGPKETIQIVQSVVNIWGSLSHPNIVRLLGHCEEDKELLLVYEFMPRGSLENHFRTIVHSTSNEGTSGSAFSSRLGIAQNTSNEGTHSGTGRAFSSCLHQVSPIGQILPIASTLKIFSFAELKTATRNFRPDTVLGDGSFGTVFKGWIDEKTFVPTKAGSGMAIAVRKFNSPYTPPPHLVPLLWPFYGEWQTEVNILGSLSHPNIVRLLGHCEEDGELLLVYEFVPRGSLGNHLFRMGASAFPLSWSTRLKIAIGAARGLAFLHCSERKIIHRDVTPFNVLIDSNYNAKISGFGLAMNGPPGEDPEVYTSVMGTYGYAAPEYVATGNPYMESDVYSFGVVLLEMLSGMRVLDANRPRVQQNLVDWAKPYLSDKRKKVLSYVMDQRLEGQYPSKGAVLAAQLILACLNYDPRKRPSMTEVVEALEQIQAIKHMPLEPKTDPACMNQFPTLPKGW